MKLIIVRVTTNSDILRITLWLSQRRYANNVNIIITIKIKIKIEPVETCQIFKTRNRRYLEAYTNFQFNTLCYYVV